MMPTSYYSRSARHALTQPQLLAAIANRAEFTKSDAKRVLDALEAVVLDELAAGPGDNTTSLWGRQGRLSRRSAPSVASA